MRTGLGRFAAVAAVAAGAAALMLFAAPAKAVEADGAKKAARVGATWLTRQQRDDGSYGGYRGASVGTTSLVLWALAPSPKQYREADGPFVTRAVSFLLANQNADGSIIARGERGLENYNTSLAVLALAALENPKYRASLVRARDFLTSIQNNEDQGFDKKEHPKSYGAIGYGTDRSGDLSNTGHALAAMVDGLRAAGIKIDEAFLKRALVFVKRCQNDPEISDVIKWPAGIPAEDRGGAKYAPEASHAGEIVDRRGRKNWRSYGSMTYVMMMSYLYAGLKPDDPAVKSAFHWIANNYTVDENPGMGEQGLYYYYHMMAKALRLCGRPIITDAEGNKHNWARDLAEKVISLRGEDGSWANENPRWGEADPVIATSYAVRTLSLCFEELKEQEEKAKEEEEADGSWDPVGAREGRAGGRPYTTTEGEVDLALEDYYRRLKALEEKETSE